MRPVTRRRSDTRSVRATLSTVVLATHDLPQARRIADWVACICPVDGRGRLIETNFCESFFCCPEHEESRRYLGGLVEAC